MNKYSLGGRRRLDASPAVVISPERGAIAISSRILEGKPKCAYDICPLTPSPSPPPKNIREIDENLLVISLEWQ
ncbi:MAG: hypothetical protein ACR2OZ_00745 [Verrucomicrobiales bacterium]